MRLRHHPGPLPAALGVAVLLATLLTLPAGTNTAARATDPASVYLAAHPGGTKLNHNEVGYGPLIVTVTHPRATTTAVADCPAGWFCFYAGTNYTYPRGKLSSCGHQNLADYGWTNRIDSVYYDMQNGKVTFYNDASVDTALFTVSTATRGDADVSPNRDKADYVYRTC
jgi:hypothetical protein